MLSTAFSPWPHFTQQDADAVSAVLLSGKVNYWTGGEGHAFEQDFATFAGTDYAIALANGTLALDLAFYGLGIGARNGGSAEDEVVVTPRTFLASVSSIVNAGARPVFADVDADTQNINARTIAPVLTEKTRGILCVHLGGYPCDMDPIKTLVQGRSIKLIEDCAQAHGAMYKGRPVGGLGDVAAWSFCQDKIMSTGGEGGMVTCNDTKLWKRMWAFKDHGKSWDAVFERDHPPGFRWLHESFGTNWRITEMQSVIGRRQLVKMPEWSAARTRNAAIISAAHRPFSGPDAPLRQIDLNDVKNTHAFYKYYAFVQPNNLGAGWSRDRIVQEINDLGVPCMHGSCSEVYKEKAFDGTGLRPDPALPVARQLGDTSIMFLVHPTLTSDEMRKTAEVSASVLAASCR